MSSSPAKTTLSSVVVVGCGGVASYLLPALLRTFNVEHLTLIDGDILEERNLDRQLFSQEQIGMNKAEALAGLLGGFRDTIIDVQREYFHEGTEVNTLSLIIACVDNHTARRNILAAADRYECQVVIAANEYTDAQGIFYDPAWQGSQRDPRVRYPEIVTDQSEDPLRPASCQGLLQQAHPQLAMANFGAANYALWLIWYWFVERFQLDDETVEACSPIEHSNNFNQFRTVRMGALSAVRHPQEQLT